MSPTEPGSSATTSDPANVATVHATVSEYDAKSEPPQAGQPSSANNSTTATATASSYPAPTAVVPPEELVAEEDETIEAAESSVDSDEFEPSEWGDDGGASTASTSVNSSIYAHTYENGRRYHSYKNGRYPIPNDDQEQNREDMKHVMMLEMTDGKLVYAPVGDYPQKIIDIGTGTGQWAIEAGDKFPSAEVLGIDLSPIQPVWIPPNVKFLIDDCEEDWLNGDNYDLVHLRFMSPVLKNVPRMCQQAFTNLRPGGWIEFQELHAWPQCDDGTMPPDDPVAAFYKLVVESFAKLGLDIHAPAKLDKSLADAGFTNVQCVVKKVPIGSWARDRRLRLIGHYLKLVIQDFLPALANKPFAALGLNQVERELWRSAAFKALDDMSAHRYWNFYFWSGQKPQ
ncbi:S-adenosyl-L-methionine-dependent methyltransferase [Truncatella angustata]|uniref:S-adenosyl-L-methionine-dependent methyltransferase n=1 Tax=Truncatella angustata TaxID=152316 RepID=A0A9P9A1H2_9PEZI|nr:S-adenosyl-L-methionine-dependent methyltransferase [Truncatella angustata]KAH6657156.1 S-adenosyl-L-methionine-dependent methyltransferase [Truncatella angustata]KAH8197606.1 hypothetical protein TruAng_008238 [Truncatella angustata]